VVEIYKFLTILQSSSLTLTINDINEQTHESKTEDARGYQGLDPKKSKFIVIG
jgi:hypothetical protein